LVFTRCGAGSGLLATAGEEAAVPVARVAGLEPGRLQVGRGSTGSSLGLLDVPPVLRRRPAGAGEAGTVAVLQPRERADRVGVHRPLRRLAATSDLAGEDRHRPADDDQAEHGP